MTSIPNDRKHLLRTGTFEKKVKDFQKLSNKEFYSTLQSNNTKYQNLSNSFNGQTSLRNTIFSVLISGVKLF